MKISFEDPLTEILVKECIKHCYYDDPENPEFSTEINKYIDNLKERLLNER